MSLNTKCDKGSFFVRKCFGNISFHHLVILIGTDCGGRRFVLCSSIIIIIPFFNFSAKQKHTEQSKMNFSCDKKERYFFSYLELANFVFFFCPVKPVSFLSDKSRLDERMSDNNRTAAEVYGLECDV